MATFKIDAGEIDLKVTADGKSFQIEQKNLKHCIIDSFYSIDGRPSVGLSLPTAELSFSGLASEVGLVFQAKEVLFNLSVKQKGQDTYTAKYRAINMDIDYMGLDAAVVLYCIIDLPEFINTTKQEIFLKKKSMEAIEKVAQDAKIQMKKPKSNITTKDEMSWVRYNISAYHFISNTCKHIYLENKEPNLIMLAMNNDKLRVIDLNTQLKASMGGHHDDIRVELITGNSSSYTPKAEIAYQSDKVRVESSLGLYSNLISGESQQPIIVVDNPDDHSNKWFVPSFLVPKTESPKFKTQRILPTKVDAGNTFKEYWTARLANERRALQLLRASTYIDVSQLLTNVNILDPIKFTAIDAKGAVDSNISGTYIVTRCSYYISVEGCATQLVVSRG